MDLVLSKQHELMTAKQGGALASELLVAFKLGGQEFGLLANCVREIIRERATTRVPNSAPSILGVINLRGRILPVFNLYQRLGLIDEAADRQNKRAVMIVEHEGSDAGLLVDEVDDVVKIGLDQIDTSARLIEMTGARHYIDGTVTLGNRLITMLRLGPLLED